MNLRVTLRRLHLYIATFIVPFIVVMSISGGLELLGIEGDTKSDVIAWVSVDSLDFKSQNLKQDVEAVFKKNGIDFSFESVKRKKRKIYTRPSYGVYYSLKLKPKLNKIRISRHTPDLIRRLMSLHKGNGPNFYQFYQKLLVVGLLLILLIGLWLGLVNVNTRRNTIYVLVAGSAFFLFVVI